MKKVRNIIVIILLLFAVFFIENEKRIPYATHCYIATAELNVRTGVGTSYPVSFALQKGEEVEVLSKKSSWYQIKYLEKVGYANSKYLKYSRIKFNIKLPTFKQIAPYIVIGVSICVIILALFVNSPKKRKREERFHSSSVGQAAFRGQSVQVAPQEPNVLESVTKSDRGTWSERDLVTKLLKYGIPAQAIFHDLYVAKYDGSFSQVDVVVVSTVGIIVFEVKDYSGWIFGSGKFSQWTKVLAYGKERYRFYNPIMQNSKHIEDLKKQLKHFENIPFYSVVVFYGNCDFRGVNFVPDRAFIAKSDKLFEVMNSIIKNNAPIQYANKDEVFDEVLKVAVRNGGNDGIRTHHIDNIKNMLGTNRIFD